jgi:hypothetical protein
VKPIGLILAVAASGAFLANAALACEPIRETRSPQEIQAAHSADRAKSKAVIVGSQCEFTNGGIYDGLSGDVAEDLGNGRVMQRLGSDNNSVLVVDCNAMEATILIGNPVPDAVSDTCGGYAEYLDVTGPNAIASLKAGSDLAELVQIFAAAGASEASPTAVLNKDPWGRNVPVRDRIDLTCGCRLFYPDTQGALN